MALETADKRVESLRQSISARRSRADSLFSAFEQTPAREMPVGHAFSFANSIHNDNAQLAAGNKAKLKAIMDSLSEKKQIAYAATPEPELADTGSLSPSPNGLPNVAGPMTTRVKASILS